MATLKAKKTLSSGESVATVLALTTGGELIEATGSQLSAVVEAGSAALSEELGAVRQLAESALANSDAWYGVEIDLNSSSPTLTRIGNLSMHKTLPIQSLMRGCLLADDGTMVDWLSPSDWTGHTRDGSRGQVMARIPQHYRRCDTDLDAGKYQVKVSEFPLPGFMLVPEMYVSAYEATVERSTQKLCSVVNLDEDYRGGNNSTSYDAADFSFLGCPATSISRESFRTYARNRGAYGLNGCGWNCYTYDAHVALYWLFVIEYATLNSQAAYDASLTSEGYHQGGLGAGVTTLDSTKWSAFNAHNPFIPCGYTDALGNGTGCVDFTMPSGYDGGSGLVVSVPRYRGVENPFGHIWKWTDGVNVRISPTVENGGDGLSKVFVCSDPSKFSGTGYEGYSHVGNEARTDGYVKSIIGGATGCIVPSAVGGGSTSYFCDYHYTNIPTSEALRGLLFGGRAHNGTNAGLACAYSYYAPSNTNAYFGSRLCFIPALRTE